MLARGEQNNPSVGAHLVTGGGECLNEQHRGACVDRPRAIKLLPGHAREVLSRAAGVVDDEHIDRTKPLRGGGDQPGRSLGDGKIGLQMREAVRTGPERFDDALRRPGVGTPRLFGVVLGPRMDQHPRAVGQQPLGDREADACPPAHPCYQAHPAVKRTLSHSSPGSRRRSPRLLALMNGR